MNPGNHSSILNIALLTILLWSTGIIPAFSQDYIFDTEIINVQDGLPHRSTHAIVQDKEGYIWISTLRGISRYDGYNFKNYERHLLNIPEGTTPYYLAIDAQNRLWYSGKNHYANFFSGLIDIRRDSIYTMEAATGGSFVSEDIIYVGNSKATKDDVIIATRNGAVYNYDGDFHEIYRFPHPLPEYMMCEALPDASYWIVHNYLPGTHGAKIFRVKHGKILQQLEVDYPIKRIVMPYPELVVETIHLSGLNQWKLEKDHLVPFGIKEHSPDIQNLLQLHQDYTCHTTKNELLVRDKQGNIIYRFDQSEFLYGNFPGCQNTLSDRQGILWVTTNNGIIKLISRKNPFKNLGINNYIRGIYREGTKLWTDTVITDLEHGTQTAIPVRDFTNAISFYKDQQENLWIAPGHNFIVCYIPRENRYVRYTYEGYDLKVFFNLVFQNPITKTWWLGARNGLFYFDPGTEKFTSFALLEASKNVHIRQFYQNAKGLWVITNTGIFLIDAKNETIIKHYTTADGLAVNDINYLYEDPQGIFWIGTKGGGLLRWDIATNSFRQYSRENGLSNNNIYAVYEDEYQTLWLPSDYGLMAFDKEAETARIYLPEHGISHEEFNTFSHFQDEDGTLYFGGLKGLTSFHPRDMQKQTAESLPLYATRVRVLEKDAEIYTDKTDGFTTAKKIVLNPGDRILEVELTLLDYEKSAENQYAYKLTSKQEQWIYTRENKLSIINPPFGKYDLVVKARGASGSWSENPLSIPMHVKAPFYLRWWFIVSSVLFTIAIIITTVQWRIRKLKKDQERLESEVKKRTRTIEQQAEDLKVLDKAKTRFFANITHEFRTPLTLVKGPVEQMIANPPSPVALKKKLGDVLKNADNLLGLINQLLDISKLEGGRMKVEMAHGDIVRYTRELVYRFQALAEKKQVQLAFAADKDAWEINTDIDKWTKIVNNLISNAIKFTPKGGRISVGLEQVQQDYQDCIQLKVNDTGIGIASENLTYIFDRFYQADASSTRLLGGTGIGLSLVKELVELQNGSVHVDSIVGKGSVFTVTLPLATISGIKAVPVMTLSEDMLLPALQIEHHIEGGEMADINGENREKLELLIIEDNTEMRSYIRSCIDASLYKISEAANGEEGVEKALEIVPDLIISDVMMPKKNGFEVTKAIREHIATSHIPLILLTAKASLESRLEGIKRGADAYLTKPFSPEELALRIKKLIEIRKLLQQRYQNQDDPPEKNTEFEKEDGFILELKNYILDNISEPDLRVEIISRHFAMSRMQLYRKIKALINKPIADYVRSIRLETALNLLREQELNITQIAYATGFSSISHFSRAFKKTYGKSPSEI